MSLDEMSSSLPSFHICIHEKTKKPKTSCPGTVSKGHSVFVLRMRVRARVKVRVRAKMRVRMRAKMMVKVVVLRGIAEDRTNELYDRFNDDRITVQKLCGEFFLYGAK
jgi:hypothetical protein